jgi:hypothetical protein
MLPNLPPDWAKLDPADQAVVDEARAMTVQALAIAAGEAPGRAGFVMRGMMLGIADQYSQRTIPAGIEATIRGVQNAFGHRWMELEK